LHDRMGHVLLQPNPSHPGCMLGSVVIRALGETEYGLSPGELGTVKNVTVSASGGKWFVSIQTQREVEQSAPTYWLTLFIGGMRY
jgi:hypothetical protein